MGVVSSVTSKVHKRAPQTAGGRTDSLVRSYIHMADCAVREQGGTLWGSQDIDLRADAFYYILNTEAVAVHSVEYLQDGSTVDGILKPTTFDRLDRLTRSWKDSRGSRPEHYLLLGTPGVESHARIMIWRPLSTVTTEKIRINYTKCLADDDSTFATMTVPEWVEDAVYVPFVLSLCWAQASPARAMRYWQDYLRGMDEVKAEYSDSYGTEIGQVRAGGTPLTDRYL